MDEYEFRIEQPPEELDKEIDFYFKLFDEKYKESLEFFKNVPTIKNFSGYGFVIKSEENYYEIRSDYFMWNSDRTKKINVKRYKNISKQYLHEGAVFNLNDIIKNEDLSLGDRLIIKNIALRALENNLEKVLEKGSAISNIDFCIRVDLDNLVREELKDYGFDLKEKVYGYPQGNVKYFDLRQKRFED